jgi:hypothetical protein
MLKDVTTGWSWGEPQRVAREDELDASRLDLQIADSARDWKAIGVTISDAMGGNHRFGWGRFRSFPGEVSVPGSNLCRAESAYRFQLEFSRAGTEGAVPDRQYSLGSLEICLQTARQQSGLPLSNGRKLQLSMRRQEDEVLFLHDRKLQMAVDGVDQRQVVSADWSPAEGEVGRLWLTGELHRRSWRQAAVTRGRAHGTQSFRLVLPPGLSQPQLHFGTYRSRFVTFTVKPKWVTP